MSNNIIDRSTFYWWSRNWWRE